VATSSWHKTGRAFDYDQTSPHLVLVSEPSQGKQYFRTYLVCKDQTGKQGVKKTLRGDGKFETLDPGSGEHLRVPDWVTE
jgi:hypothetical protein